MTLNDLAQGEPWMTPEEHQTVAALVQSFQQHFSARHVPEDPFLTLRVEDVLFHHTLCRRLQRNLATAANDPSDTLTPALAAHLGRARERLRKAVSELESTAKRLAAAADGSPLPANSAPQKDNTSVVPVPPPAPPTSPIPVPPPQHRLPVPSKPVIHVPNPIPNRYPPKK